MVKKLGIVTEKGFHQRKILLLSDNHIYIGATNHEIFTHTESLYGKKLEIQIYHNNLCSECFTLVTPPQSENSSAGMCFAGDRKMFFTFTNDGKTLNCTITSVSDGSESSGSIGAIYEIIE